MRDFDLGLVWVPEAVVDDGQAVRWGGVAAAAATADAPFSVSAADKLSVAPLAGGRLV